MKDTPLEVERRFRATIMARSPQERLSMGLRMFDAARGLMIAGMRAKGIEPTRTAVFLRTYCRDFTAEERNKIVARLATAHSERS